MTSTYRRRTGRLAGVWLFWCGAAWAAAEPRPDMPPTIVPGDATLVLAEYHVWHGLPSHSAAFSDPPCFRDRRAYDSKDPAVIARHIAQARAMGIDGLVVDWYGPPVAGLANDADRGFMDAATLRLFAAAETQAFGIALLYDEGAVKNSGLPTAEYEERVIADLRYAERYFSSPAYLPLAGRPALFVFPYPDVDGHLDWARIRAALSRTVTLLDQDPNPDDWDRHDAKFDGFYAWVQPSGSGWDPHGCEWGEAYLRWFYGTMRSGRYADKIMVGGVWPGFDDSLAPWGQDRFISRNRGAVWHDTWQLAAEHHAENVMIATWNDFEEGTDVEYGIEMVADMEDPTPEVLMRSSPLTVTWDLARGEKPLQIYHDCLAEPIYDQPRTPGASFSLEGGEAYEIKLWVDGSSTLRKLVKVRRQDPLRRCLPAGGP